MFREQENGGPSYPDKLHKNNSMDEVCINHIKFPFISQISIVFEMKIYFKMLFQGPFYPMLFPGPIVGGLVNKFGCRPVCITGKITTIIIIINFVYQNYYHYY